MSNTKRYLNGATVSRDLVPDGYSWDTVIVESGKPITDADLNLVQDYSAYRQGLANSVFFPSGFIREQSIKSVSGNPNSSDYVFFTATAGNENKLGMIKRTALVAGIPIVIEYTNTTTPGQNVVTLPAASLSSGGIPETKRTDFVFLEVWRAQVAPSPRATGSITVASPQTISDGDTVTIDTTAIGGPAATLTARTVPALITEFGIGINPVVTANNLATAINNPAWILYPTYVASNTSGTSIATITSVSGGAAGNTIALSASNPAHTPLSGPTFTGGADTPNKPTQNSIYHWGNVLAPNGVSLPDNLIDPVLNVESTQRIQVQYRFRIYSSNTLSGINPKTSPDGFSNTNILAQGAEGSPVATYPFVPADKTSVSANSNAPNYGLVDPGLWIAGDGSSGAASALGTADGFVYAVPICMVFRRNDASIDGGFDPANNANGALSFDHGALPNTHLSNAGPVTINANASDRPDGMFHDQISDTDVWDMRRSVSLNGLDMQAELRYQLHSLLSGRSVTWFVDGSDLSTIGNGSGDISLAPMMCDVVGREINTAGNTIRQFDHIARRFGSQHVIEKLVFSVLPAGPYPTGISVTKSGGTVKWHSGDIISIDFNQLEASSLQDWTNPAIGGPKVSAAWPSGTKITDITNMWHDDGMSGSVVSQATQTTTITGIGTTLLQITLDSNPTAVNGGGTVGGGPMVDTGMSDTGSARRVFIEVEVSYPIGVGLKRTPSVVIQPTPSSGYTPYNSGPVVEYDPSQRPSDMDPGWVPNPVYRNHTREVMLEAKSNNPSVPGAVIVDHLVTATATDLYTPRRVQTTTSLLANGAPPATVDVGSSSRHMTLAVAVGGQTEVTVNYYPQDPVPSAGSSGYTLYCYYRSSAPQTAGVQTGPIPTNLLPEQVMVEPVAISDEVWEVQAGVGSTSGTSPFDGMNDFITVPNIGSGLPKDWYFCASAEVDTAVATYNTGFLSLKSSVPVIGVDSVQIGSISLGSGTSIDGEFRAYYSVANPNSLLITAQSDPLYGSTRHKNFTAMLVRSTVDTRLFRTGDILLVIMSRFADLDSSNNITFTTGPSPRTVASIYRTRNQLTTASP